MCMTPQSRWEPGGSAREAVCVRWPRGDAGLVYRALGFPPDFFTVLFAVPRVVGYLSHWREALTDPDVKIMRPQEDYRVPPPPPSLPLPCLTTSLFSCLSRLAV